VDTGKTIDAYIKLIKMIRFAYTRGYQKVPGLGQKRNAGLTYSILAAISFKIVSLGTYKLIPSFLPCFKSTGNAIWEKKNLLKDNDDSNNNKQHC
jgi:hypothetical protein